MYTLEKFKNASSNPYLKLWTQNLINFQIFTIFFIATFSYILHNNSTVPYSSWMFKNEHGPI